MKLTEQETEFIEKFIADYKAGDVTNYAIGWVSDSKSKCSFGEGGNLQVELQLYASHFVSIMDSMREKGFTLSEIRHELSNAVRSFSKQNIKGFSGDR